jgi:hypothetical protein
MSNVVEVFVSTHDVAVKRAAALDQGAAGSGEVRAVQIPGITDLDIEILGGVAGTAVHAPGANFELVMVDVESDSLLAVPAAMVRVLAELPSFDNADDSDADETDADDQAIDAVAREWSRSEDLPLSQDQAKTILMQLAELASQVDESKREELFVWTGEA